LQTLRAEAGRHGVEGVNGLDTRALVRQILAHEQEDAAITAASAAPVPAARALGRRVNSGPSPPAEPQPQPPRPEHLPLDRRQQPQQQQVTATPESLVGATDTQLRTLMGQGYAVDLGSLHNQRRRLVRQRQLAARSEQAQQTIQSHQAAYDYGPRSRQVELARPNRPSHWILQPGITRGTSGPLSRTVETDQQHRPQRDMRQQQDQQTRHRQQQQQQQQQTQQQPHAAFQPAARPTTGASRVAELLQGALRPTTFPPAQAAETPVGFFAPSTLAPLAPGVLARISSAPLGTDQTTIDNATALMTFPGGPSRAAGGTSVAASVTTAPPVGRNQGSLNIMSIQSIKSDPGRESEVVGRARSGSNNVQLQCSVCLEAFQPGEELRLLPCFHRFHVSCIDAWLARNPACPVCKHSILAN